MLANFVSVLSISNHTTTFENHVTMPILHFFLLPVSPSLFSDHITYRKSWTNLYRTSVAEEPAGPWRSFSHF